MKLEVGDAVIGVKQHNQGVIREIVEVRKSGYTWKYLESENEYLSEDSSDPHFELGWKKITKDEH